MTNAPPIVEVALLLLAVFVIGCFIGLGLRRLALRSAAGSVLPQTPLALAKHQSAPLERVQEKWPHFSGSNTRPFKDPERHFDSIEMDDAPDAPVVPALPAPAESESPGPAIALPPRRSGKKDNLKQIKGIGPKVEATLHELGVFRFDQIAHWDQPAIAAIDQRLAFKGRIERENWVAQARDLAAAQTSGRPPRS